jgi:hypothetical protein
MHAFKTEAVVTPDGTLTLRGLPFGAGDRVEVIVLGQPRPAVASEEYPLRGQVLRYDRPTDPVVGNEWEASW